MLTRAASLLFVLCEGFARADSPLTSTDFSAAYASCRWAKQRFRVK